jgi:Lar family restriction alleviation protein
MASTLSEFTGRECPFCLSDDTRVWFSTYPKGEYCVLCLTCEAEGPHAESANTAIELWNRRDDRARAALKRLGSMEALTTARAIKMSADRELLARIEFARAAMGGSRG